MTSLISLAWITALSVIACGIAGVLLWPRRRMPGASMLIVLVALAGVWSVSYTAELLATPTATKLLFHRLNYVPVALLCPTWLVLAAQLVGRDDWLTARRLAVVLGPPTFFVLLGFTNECHGLMWESVARVAVGATTLLEFERGPAFWAMVAYSYGCFVVGSALAVTAIAVGPALLRRDAFVLLLGALIPVVTNVLFLLGHTPVPHYDPTPVAFVGSAAIWSFSIVRLRLHDVVPLVRDRVLRGMSDLVLAIDHADRVTDLNPAACDVLGVRAAEVLGNPVGDMFPEAAWRTLASCQSGSVEIALSGADAIHIYDVRIEALRGVRGTELGRLLVLRDQTERKRAAEAQLRLSRHETSASMVTGLAHRFEGLLGTLRGNAQLVAERCAGDPIAMAYAIELKTAATRASELVEQMMYFSQEVLLEARPVRVAGLVAQVVERERVRVPDNVRVVCSREAGALEVIGDVASLHQVVLGLLRNAIEAVAERGVVAVGRVAVEVRRERLSGTQSGEHRLPRGDYVVLCVSDDGVGMDPETVARVFEPFFTTKGLGRGLGLAVAYGTVRSHRGEITIESAPGEGTSVNVYLPAISPRGRIRDVAAPRSGRPSSRPANTNRAA